MTKHTDTSRSTDSGVSGNAQTGAGEIRVEHPEKYAQAMMAGQQSALISTEPQSTQLDTEKERKRMINDNELAKELAAEFTGNLKLPWLPVARWLIDRFPQLAGADRDTCLDREWLAGAACGFNYGVADNPKGFDAAMAVRQRQIAERNK